MVLPLFLALRRPRKTGIYASEYSTRAETDEKNKKKKLWMILIDKNGTEWICCMRHKLRDIKKYIGVMEL